MITIDIEKAKEIKKDSLRRERAPVLKQLDVEFVRSLESGDTQKQAEIAAKKQSLRDITELPELLTAETVEELKAISLSQVLGE